MRTIKFFSLTALMLLMSSSTMAQLDSKSELSFSVGGETPNQKGIIDGMAEAFGSAFGKMLGTIITLGQVDLTDKNRTEDSYTPTFSIQYLYRVAPTLKVGGLIAYQQTSSTLEVEDTNGSYHEAAKATNNYFIVMPTAKHIWSEKKNTGFYSKLAAGICIADNSAKMADGVKEDTPGEVTNRIKSGKGTRFAYQISAIGFEAGTSHLRAFIELGYGFQGFAQLGASYKF